MGSILALFGCSGLLASGPIPPPDRLVGEHCISSDPLGYYYQQKLHTPDELRARRAFARSIEPTRFKIGADGSVSVRQVDGKVSTGVVVGATQHPDGWGAKVRWNGGHPPGPVLGADDLLFRWSGTSNLVRVTGAQPGSVAGEWLQVAPLDWCLQTDDAHLRDGAAPFTAPPTGQPAEPWAADASAWPQLVLTNDVQFKDGREMPGASSFLLRAGGKLVLGTALHLIGPAGGIDPAVPLAQLDEQLRSWTAFVRTRRQPSVQAAGVALTSRDEDTANDWLALRVEEAGPLPATPLTLRTTPVGVGERVWLVGCEYRDADCTQRVIGGRVSGRNGGKFRYDLDTPVILQGFSGAPVLDARGLVVGLMSLYWVPYEIDGADLEGGGVDASGVVPLLTGTWG